MAAIDIFREDAFGMLSLTQAVEKVPYRPSMLGSMGLFTPSPIRTDVAAIEVLNGALSLIQTTERGAPLAPANVDKRNMVYQKVPRLAKQDVITAASIANVRAFGSESELQQVQSEVARRFLKLRQDVELTKENMRLGAIRGIVKDADGSDLVNWYTKMNEPEPSAVNFDLAAASPASGVVRKKCAEVVRKISRAAGAYWTNGTNVMGLAGDAFFDDLIAHTEVRATYLNQQEAAQLREGYAFEMVRYGGITFVNYRSTDDGGTAPQVGIGTNECRFFPVNALPGFFQEVLAPAEFFDFVNQPGRDIYAMQIPDRDRNAHVTLEVYSYPLMVCTRPAALIRGTRTG